MPAFAPVTIYTFPSAIVQIQMVRRLQRGYYLRDLCRDSVCLERISSLNILCTSHVAVHMQLDMPKSYGARRNRSILDIVYHDITHDI
jgi:hypothetical protein